MSPIRLDLPAGSTRRPLEGDEAATLAPVLDELAITPTGEVERYVDLRMTKTYDVYRVPVADPPGAAVLGAVVLKRAGAAEFAAHRRFLTDASLPVSPMLRSTADGGWLVFAWLAGHDLQRCSTSDAVALGNALARVQASHWQPAPTGLTAEQAALDRDVEQDQRWMAQWPELEDGLVRVRRRWRECPWTLAHGDLYGMNVLVSEGRATLIDWNEARLAPWTRDAARFLAFARPDGGVYQLGEAARETFVASWLDELTGQLGGAAGVPGRELLEADLAGALLVQHVHTLAWTVRAEAEGRPNPGREKWFGFSLEAAHQAAAGLTT